MLIVTALGQGRAFEAEYEVVRSRAGLPSETEKGALYVDRMGRVRQEFVLDTPVASISDPVIRVVGLVDIATGRLLVRGPFPAGEQSPPELVHSIGLAQGLQSAAPVTSEDLGSQEIDGMKCRGYRIRAQTASGEDTYETWVSDEFGVVLFQTHTSLRQHETFRLFNLRRGEPEPSLFEIPSEHSRSRRSALAKFVRAVIKRQPRDK